VPEENFSNEELDAIAESGGMEFYWWLTKIGKSRSTGIRWSAKGWITPVNIGGYLFVTTAEIRRFWSRAKAGEFARKPAGAAAVGGRTKRG